MAGQALGDLVAQQQRQACELAWGALDAGLPDDAVMTWFVTEQIRFPMKWGAYVFMALIDKNKQGVHRWKEARRPFGLIRTIAWRAAFSWQPDLIFNTEQDLRAKSAGFTSFDQAAKGLKRSGHGGGGEGSGRLSSFDVVENAGHNPHKQNLYTQWWTDGGYEEEDPDAEWFDQGTSRESIVLQACREFGFDEDECQVIVWRHINRLSRRALEDYWDERRVGRVWHRVTEKFGKPEFRVRFLKLLRIAIDNHRLAHKIFGTVGAH